MEEEKTGPADSMEAKLYKQAQDASADTNGQQKPAHPPPLRRPMKRRLFMNGSETAEKDASKVKLNTLEKSKLDWAAHVDKEGISDELNEAGKAKNAYLDRVDFLGRMDAKRDEESRRNK